MRYLLLVTMLFASCTAEFDIKPILGKAAADEGSYPQLDDPANTMTKEESDAHTLKVTLGKPAGEAEVQLGNFIMGLCKQPDQTIDQLKRCMEETTICNAEGDGSIYNMLACAKDALE